MNGEEIQLKAGKCKVVKQEIERLGFELTSSGISPINIRQSTRNIGQTQANEFERDFFGAVNQFNSCRITTFQKKQNSANNL